MLFLGVHVFYVKCKGEVERMNEEESLELKRGCPQRRGGELSVNDVTGVRPRILASICASCSYCFRKGTRKSDVHYNGYYLAFLFVFLLMAQCFLRFTR